MYRVREEFDRRRPSPASMGSDAQSYAAPGINEKTSGLPRIGTADVLGWIIRSIRLIIILALVGGLAGFTLYSLIPARYTAHVDLLIEPQNLKVATNDLFSPNLQGDSQLLDVESKMRVMTSGNVLERVATKLKLAEDASFGRSWIHLPDFLKSPAANDRRLSVLLSLSERVKVVRQERSYVVTVSVWGESPQQAVDIANALVEGFEAELNESEAREAGRIASSLRGRLGSLKSDVAEADARVEGFRARHDLQKGGGGKLLNSQSMDGLNDKIADIRVQVAQAATRYRDISEALRNGTDSDVLRSPVITSLRIEQAALDRKLASLASTYGNSYPSVIEARDEHRSLERAIKSEHNRLLEAARTEMVRSKQVLATLEGNIAAMKKMVSSDDSEQIELRELERTATAKAAVYQAALNRTGEVSERGRLDAVDVRAITDATLPVKPSWPPSRAVLTLAGAVLGLLLGMTVAAALGLARMTSPRRNFSPAA